MKSISKAFAVSAIALAGCIGWLVPVSAGAAAWISEDRLGEPPYFYVRNPRGDALAFGCFESGEPGDDARSKGVRFFVELHSESLAWVSGSIEVENPWGSSGFSRWYPDDEHDPSGLVFLFRNDDHLLSAVGSIDDWLSLGVEGVEYRFPVRGIEQQAIDLLVRCRLFESESVDGPYRAPAASSSEGASNRSEYGDTPLHAAIRGGDEAGARSLIATMSRADLCTKNDLEQTPFDLATIFDFTDIQLILMQLDASYRCRH
ncbi:MAG: ankyrin repeat domain-containing protein [Ectothiorhodospiraceae bacterium AqS1]|nr:ankyrin repeat domain-containing protein [Ectothiorhodospiraceae bacterium AqS1]MBF2761780.1 ankyrin repeat domain-containing protein [Ectothiorhodospiraceae bacterium AqS1]